jgi:hypothetical protein
VSKISTRFSFASSDRVMSLRSFARTSIFSVLFLRLRAAAHALFPPKGEKEKKSKTEAQRHSRVNLARG